MHTTKYLIIGAGHAGVVAAMAARSRDPDGRIVMIGEEAALPYERPALSKAFLAGEPSEALRAIYDADRLSGSDIELISGVRAENILPHQQQVTLNDGTLWKYQHLLLTTGSRVRPLDIPGATMKQVHYLRTATDAIALRETLATAKHLVVIGAGFVGLEVAATARKSFGCRVTVLEAGPEVLQRGAPERLREAVRELHQKNNVEFRLKTIVNGLADVDGKSIAIQLANDETIKADAVLICIGVLPNIDIATRAGLETAQGILTDAFGRTTVPDIWAGGEVAQHVHGSPGELVRYESWQMAQTQAAIVGANMAGAQNPITYVPWFWTDHFSHNFQMLGRTDPDLDIAVRCYEDDVASTAVFLDGKRVVGALCINSGRDIAPIRKAISEGWVCNIALFSDSAEKLKKALGPL